MKLTTEHSASSYGMPVFVDDDNQLVIQNIFHFFYFPC